MEHRFNETGHEMNFEARIFPDRKRWAHWFEIEETSESAVYNMNNV